MRALGATVVAVMNVSGADPQCGTSYLRHRCTAQIAPMTLDHRIEHHRAAQQPSASTRHTRQYERDASRSAAIPFTSEQPLANPRLTG